MKVEGWKVCIIFATFFMACLISCTPTFGTTIIVTPTPLATLILTATVQPPTHIHKPSTATSAPTFAACRIAATPTTPRNTIKRLAYIDASNATHDVWLWDMGKKPVQLTTLGKVIGVSISTDGKTITFTRQPAPEKTEDWTIRADGTGLRQLPPRKPQTDSREFAYSPDDKWMLVYSDNGIALYDSDEHPYNFPSLPNYTAIDEDGHHLLLPPVWSLDSKSFLLVLPTSVSVYKLGSTFKVTRIWPASQRVDDIGIFTGFAPSAKFSPDQQFMSYYADGSLRPTKLHFADLNEKKDIIFSKQDALELDSWSPNSRDFIFLIDSFYIGNICQPIENAIKLSELNLMYQFPYWVDDTTLLIVELGDDRLNNRVFFFEDVTGNYKKQDSVMGMRSYDFVTLSP